MKDRFEVLDVFRGLFSAMVVFFHMSAFASTVIINNRFIDNSDLFVDFFFVLSGFVMAYSYRQITSASEWKTFMRKRLQRLYPLHLIMLLVFVIMEVGKHALNGHIQVNNLNNINNNWLTFFSSLFLLNSIKLPGVTDVSWNIPSWSISAEMISYVVFSLLLFGLYKLFATNSKTPKIITAFVIVLSAITVIYLVEGSFQMNYSFDYGFLRGLAGFFTGVCCLSLFTSSRNWLGKQSPVVFHVAEVLMLSVIIYCISNGHQYKSYGYLYEIIFFLAVFVFAFEKGFVSRLLKASSLLKNMGKYSYSIYMTHAFLLSIFNIVFIRICKLPPSAYSYLFILNYILIYKVSQWTYQHIEMRFTKIKSATKKDMVSNDQPEPAVATA